MSLLFEEPGLKHKNNITVEAPLLTFSHEVLHFVDALVNKALGFVGMVRRGTELQQ
jgi:hypothetical protein